ncbi:hypothetical protein [Actinomycetospora termitidis]|uniref:Uncharacterized protein n=1 Tax=Actinomycetospora termitidis TaxID=3053470 RepID=A0ABT7M6J0_9PSEU|nr:hypothetical protein [Actinomycetospora sp. Odt1-22]MDL5156153.1 hypothetical protein [Actinomycetospora sp. Odt1-22]
MSHTWRSGVLITYSFTTTAVTVRRWFEVGVDAVMETGARIELALRDVRPHRGSESAAQPLVVDRTFWRADIFGRLDRPDAPYGAAHFHPHFDGDEPSDRVWDRHLTEHPWEWLDEQLRDLGRLLRAAGLPDEPDEDAEALRLAAPQIVATARSLGPEVRLDRDETFRLTRDASHRIALMVELAKDRPDLDLDHLAPWLERDRAQRTG